MAEILRGKRRDGAWMARELTTEPNWAIVELLMKGKPVTCRGIYSALGKRFTRKTLIRSIRVLSLEIKAMLPQHVKGGTGYDIGYYLSPEAMEFAKQVAKYQSAAEKRE